MPKKTPWGDADYETPIIPRAVTWVTTPTHGGLMISRGWAEKNLSEACLDEALVHQGYYCFEEDCAWSLVAHENEVVFNALLARDDKGLGEEHNRASLLKDIDTSLGAYYKNYLAKRGGTFDGLTFQNIHTGDRLILGDGTQYYFVEPYTKAPKEWIVRKNGSKLYRLSWNNIQAYIGYQKAKFIRVEA